MNCKDFVAESICKLEKPIFEKLKQLLIGEYISFSIIDPKDVTRDVLAEKVCDYFETLEVKMSKPFDKCIESYLIALDAIVGPHIAMTPPPKKGESKPVVPRTRRYYEKAIELKSVKNLSMGQLLDYSRIMLCLYAAAIKSGDKPIENFNYAAECLVPLSIIEAMKNEEVAVFFLIQKRFDTKERYSDGMCMMILSIVILCTIINGTVEGDTNRE